MNEESKERQSHMRCVNGLYKMSVKKFHCQIFDQLYWRKAKFIGRKKSCSWSWNFNQENKIPFRTFLANSSLAILLPFILKNKQRMESSKRLDFRSNFCAARFNAKGFPNSFLEEEKWLAGISQYWDGRATSTQWEYMEKKLSSCVHLKCMSSIFIFVSSQSKIFLVLN